MIEDSTVSFRFADPAENHQHHPNAVVVNPENRNAGLFVELEARIPPGNSGRRRFHAVLFDPIELRGREPR